MKKPNIPTQYHFFQNGKNEKIDAHLPTEAPVSLTVNGEAWLTFMCTPSLLEALAIGFLFNEDIIKNFDEVADVRVCEHGDNVDVWLNHAAEKPKKWTRTSGCTGGMTSIDASTQFSAGTHASHGLARQQNGVMLSPKDIPLLLKMLDENQTLYRQSGGIHTSVLTDGEKVLAAAEDIGRHNTLDKIAGQMLMGGITPKTIMILTTGRISSEMMQKAIRLGVSVVISRTSPSSMSVELAEQQGITLIGYAKRHRFNLYTHPERITSVEKEKEI
ncbi:MAG: formate dehydrogenase accessory sulfurtransferase FdhD [Anaerolineae bacterium]|jgi:FdhD protein|nr:formate dehydrogenase accessory sulfurtransferase FdhD [Anaerolineae bacterium]MBT7191747.1 formate dehydrogenase accessory sulfurtransferase FdhD [Anaerolineae bacterium]MBT7989137.1 formate dehydrogenase accessory sulfurtransferase FdhD [Anaerolineae bacterium]